MATYQPTDWYTGQLITENLLDKIEQQLALVTPGATDSVRYDIAQNLTETEKQQARDNIGAGDVRSDGLYTTMTVGNAEQLVSSKSTTDKMIYNFRPTGENLDVGNRSSLEKIIGGTVYWNQLCDGETYKNNPGTQGSITITNNQNGSYTLSGGPATGSKPPRFTLTSTEVFSAIPKGHVVYMNLGCPTESSTDRFALGVLYTGDTVALTDQTNNSTGRLWKIPSEGNCNTFCVRIYLGTDFTNAPITITPQLFDLTQMLGSDIAEALYEMEQNKSGAGVAYFRGLFPKSYYPYNPGEFVSVQVSAHEMIGFNAFNPNINTAKLLGGYQYQITGSYDSLTYEYAGGTETITPTTSNKYFTPVHNGVLTVVNGSNVCIHFVYSGERNQEYVPYVKYSYPLDSTKTLLGIPVWFPANQAIFYIGDTYESNGTYTHNVTELNLYDLTWTREYNTTSAYYYFKSEPILTCGYQKLLSNVYTYVNNTNAALEDKTMTLAFGASVSESVIHIRDDAYETVEDFISALTQSQATCLYYLVASAATIDTAAAFTSVQTIDDWGTEEFVSVRSDVQVPVGHETKYYPNLRDKLQHLPDVASANGDYIIKQTNNFMSLADFDSVLDKKMQTNNLILQKSNNIINYHYEQEGTIAAISMQQGTTKSIQVNRNKMIIKIDGSLGSFGSPWFVKLNNSLAANTASGVPEFSEPLTDLTVGHTYQLCITPISGTMTVQNNGFVPYVTKGGEESYYGTRKDNNGDYITEFVYTGGNGVHIGIGIYANTSMATFNNYEALVMLKDVTNEIPPIPLTTDGTFILKATVADGEVTYTWEAAE